MRSVSRERLLVMSAAERGTRWDVCPRRRGWSAHPNLLACTAFGGRETAKVAWSLSRFVFDAVLVTFVCDLHSRHHCHLRCVAWLWLAGCGCCGRLAASSVVAVATVVVAAAAAATLLVSVAVAAVFVVAAAVAVALFPSFRGRCSRLSTAAAAVAVVAAVAAAAAVFVFC